MDRKFVEFRLAPDDLTAVRFGVSPGHELVHAVRALARPHEHPLQWGWVRGARERAPREAFDLLRLVIGDDGYAPDAFTSPAAWDLTPDEELARLRATALAPLAVDLGKRAVRETGHPRRALRAMQADPERARRLIADAAEAFWAAAVAPVWDRLERLLHADIATRTRRMTAGGLAAVFEGLNEAVEWRSDSVRVRLRRHHEVLDCTGRGLVLVPSLFGRRCAALTEPPAQPTLYYPALGVSERWHDPAADVGSALAALMGERRAALFLALGQPMSTSEAAGAAGIAVSTASHHLDALRAAGLVDARREGRRVLHVRTPLGDALASGR